MIIFIPFYLEEMFDRSPVEIGIAISLNTLFAGFAALFNKRLISKLNYMKMFAILLIIMRIGNLIVGSTNEYVLLIIGLILMGIAFGWFVPNITGWLFGHIHGPIRSRAIGGFTFALFAGQFTSPILGNLIRGNNPISYIFTVTGIFLLVISIFFIARSFTPEKEHSINGN